MLGHGDMGDHRVVPHQDHDRDRCGRDVVPRRSGVTPAGLIVDPGAGREVHPAVVRLIEERRHQQVRAEQVLVLDQPRRRIVRVLEE